MRIKIEIKNKDGRAWGPVINEEDRAIAWLRNEISLGSFGKHGEYDITVTKQFKGLSLWQKVKLLFDGEKVVEFNPSTKLLNESVK